MSISVSTPTLISSTPDLKAFLSSLPTPSTLYLDLEGKSLSRFGTISLITILVHPQKVVRLIDVTTLGKSAFTTAADNNRSLKSILEDPDTPKYIWDVRNDADALWALYDVGLAGVIDLQLLENASRPGDKTYIHGLDKCVQADLKLGFMELHRWIRTKKDIQNLMPSNVFASRPMDDKTVQYCVNDVIHLPTLHTRYLKRLQGGWLTRVVEQSVRRVEEAHSPGYDPQSLGKKLGPWGSGTEKKVVTVDEMCDMLEEEREDNLARGMFDEDEVGYYVYDYYDDYVDERMNCADGAVFPEAFDSCWDKNS
ncbi:hypothetical protein FQN54_002230 [Arachnomyces sp. PD_36]|nr:hypothetical protein FQN54_002230 [Arachnomyces sp. PD_36]